MTETRTLPLLPLRDIVVFPHMIVPLFVGREKSVRALEEVMRGDKQILLATQLSAADDDPSSEAIYGQGVIASVLQLLKLPDGTVKVLVEGGRRMEVLRYLDNQAYFEAEARLVDETGGDAAEMEALMRAAGDKFEDYVKLNKKVPPEALAAVGEIADPAKMADTIAAHLAVKITDKQELLGNPDVAQRLEKVFALMEGEISVLQVETKIRNRVKRQMEKTQREYYLNEQMKAIQRELGEGDDGREEMAELEERIEATKLSKEARAKVDAEMKKLRQMSPMSAEATVVRNYLDWILSIPWNKRKKVRNDLKKAEDTLERDHYGLEKVKERIIEHLAVQARTRKLRGPILCLVGPPGVGKTSLGRSIAEATGREFVRMSLGGVRDEAEIRGHRRTYIGSMPGRVIQSMKKAKSSNPLFLLDEIDKLGADYRGDPSAALLEVLDPEQNSAFNDHYLEVDYDLSDVMFITTANTLNMPQPLLDRMEIIRIAGYTEDEKLEIARRHLIPKVMKAHALNGDDWVLEDAALRDLIRYYTRESGVRNLEREISRLARKAVRKLVGGEADKITVTSANLPDFAGGAQTPLRRDRAGGPRGSGHGSGLDRGGRRFADHRSGQDARTRQDDGDRESARCDEGIHLGGQFLCPVTRPGAGREAAGVPHNRHPRARARRRDAQGRPVGGRRHDHGHCVGAHWHSGAQGRGHDGRDHAARPGFAHWRPERKAARGPARRGEDGADPQGQ